MPLMFELFIAFIAAHLFPLATAPTTTPVDAASAAFRTQATFRAERARIYLEGADGIDTPAREQLLRHFAEFDRNPRLVAHRAASPGARAAGRTPQARAPRGLTGAAKRRSFHDEGVGHAARRVPTAARALGGSWRAGR